MCFAVKRGLDMIFGYYFRLLKLTKIKWLSVFFAKVLYIFRIIKFKINELKVPKTKVDMSYEEALEIVENTHPDIKAKMNCNNLPINDEIDLSIVVPVYNYASKIQANIESVLAQKTKYNYQLILVDDGSTDGSRDIVLKYENLKNVKVILQDNKGIAGARNTGIDAANGKYLMFIDCDDTIHDDMVETMLNCAFENDNDIVMTAHSLVKERNGQVTSVIPNIYPDADLYNYGKEAKILNYPGLPWGKVYKREMFNNVRFLEGYWYEDTIIHWLLFSQCKSFKYIPKVEYDYMWYENNFSHVQGGKKSVKSIDRYWMLKVIIEQYLKIGLEKNKLFYILLLTHLSQYYYSDISNLEKRTVDALFILACELFDEYKPNRKYKLPYKLRKIEKSLTERNIELWKMYSVM